MTSHPDKPAVEHAVEQQQDEAASHSTAAPNDHEKDILEMSAHIAQRKIAPAAREFGGILAGEYGLQQAHSRYVRANKVG